MSTKKILFYLKDEKYGFLSNFYPSFFIDEEYDCSWETNEHYYQANKAKDLRMGEWIRKCPKPFHAMKAGRALRKERGEFKEDWDTLRLEVMKRGLRYKFGQNPHLAKKLLETGDAFLGEDSPTDMFWGVRGENHLGRLLMEVREELRERQNEEKLKKIEEEQHE